RTHRLLDVRHRTRPRNYSVSEDVVSSETIMKTLLCQDLDEAIESYTNDRGYRLDMIKPADSPRIALLSKDGKTMRLESTVPEATETDDWITGRAGMEYRDLIPERLDAKVIA